MRIHKEIQATKNIYIYIYPHSGSHNVGAVTMQIMNNLDKRENVIFFLHNLITHIHQ